MGKLGLMKGRGEGSVDPEKYQSQFPGTISRKYYNACLVDYYNACLVDYYNACLVEYYNACLVDYYNACLVDY